MTCANSASAADSTSMPLIADTDSSPVTDQIRKRCAKQQNCKVEASRPFFESVPSTSKYLKVWHECIPDVSRVILPTRKTKREFRFPRQGGARSTGSKSYGEGLGTSSSLNMSSIEESIYGGKSNEQISSNASTAGKEKRNEASYENAPLAGVLDELLGPSSLYK